MNKVVEKNMSSPKGKEIMSLVRGGDYSHAGEVEAIDFVFKRVAKDSNRQILDVGCGRGGTAEYLHKNGFGIVSGFDNDELSIEYAKQNYPSVNFKVCDALHCSNCYDTLFDMQYMLNVLFYFNHDDQLRCLKELRQLAKENGTLIIFDYTAFDTNASSGSHYKDNWFPINTDEFPGKCQSAGWKITDEIDCTELFHKWYSNVLDQIRQKREAIIELADAEWFTAVESVYIGHVKQIESKQIGLSTYYLQAG